MTLETDFSGRTTRSRRAYPSDAPSGVISSGALATVEPAYFLDRMPVGLHWNMRLTNPWSVRSFPFLPTPSSRGNPQSRPFPARALKVMESAGQPDKAHAAPDGSACEKEGVATAHGSASGRIFHRQPARRSKQAQNASFVAEPTRKGPADGELRSGVEGHAGTRKPSGPALSPPWGYLGLFWSRYQARPAQPYSCHE